ncbi:type II toxin-antitoxin system Phd/YefM family antitoxin [Tsukamurella sp. PLM1]|uniref:type II toxin-antitoxin system Phd/YefM family antitoxin n=1 Tax=Tsukamurella sp. PLM1 TaxID=2929795 RepID=UPI0020C00EA8|nr:type II toxin-antitoxin system Phd/YefM family antitoxin [Tsukamurella sp. PLM1]
MPPEKITATATDLNRRPSEYLAMAIDGMVVEILRNGRSVAVLGPLSLLNSIMKEGGEGEMTDDQLDALMSGINGVRSAMLEVAEAIEKSSKRFVSALDQSDSVRVSTTARTTTAIEDLTVALGRRG